MFKVWSIFYNAVVIPLLILFFRIAALFNAKIKTGLQERKRLFENLIIDLTGLDRKKKMVWFHSSSMGEFEQAKPIIKKLKSENDINLIVTFFSPSGYKNSLNYQYADIIAYLPLDTASNARRFVNLVKPSIAVFMRYDIWPNVVWQLKNKKVPTFLVDATMRARSKRKWMFAKSFHKALFGNFTQILTVSQTDLRNFKDFDIKENKIKAVGDTRFDRVYEKSIEAKNKNLFKDGIFEGKKVFVMGSSWEADENIVLDPVIKAIKYDPNIILILVPHEPTLIRLEKLENYLRGKVNSIRFSLLNNYDSENVILIDSIGILLTLYYYADAAYVGGSFKQGIHNVLEPAVYGIPVLYGPKIENSQEAQTLIEEGGGMVIRSRREAYRTIRNLFSNDILRAEIGQVSSKYINDNLGATEKITHEIQKYI
jgi:3-deoxy-D-manno-octulosonic-acid transferase